MRAFEILGRLHCKNISTVRDSKERNLWTIKKFFNDNTVTRKCVCQRFGAIFCNNDTLATC